MKKKNIIPMPGKVGKVGRKKLPSGQNKVHVIIHKKEADIALLGGQEEVKRSLSDIFDERLRVIREYSPVALND